MSDLNIAMILRLVDQVSGPSRRVLASMRELGAAVDGAGLGMISTADRLGDVQARQMGIVQRQAIGIAGLATAAYGLLRPAVQFEAAMDRVGAVAGASDAEVARLTATARELGATTPWAASQAAEGMQFLAQAGFDVNETIAAMPGLLNLASAGATDLGTTADIASNILSGFGMEAAQMGRVGDVLTNAFTASNVNLQMLGETMAYVAPQAAAVGVSIEDAAAMAGKLGDAGIQGSRAGTALRSMISRLAGPTGEAATALERLGVETADADGNLRPMIEILAEMDAAMKDLGSAEQATLNKAIFGEEASAAAQVLMIQAGSGALREFAGEMREQGSAARVAERQNDNFAGMMKQIGSVSEALAITIGTLLLPALTDFAAEIGPVLQGINDWAEANPELVRAIGQLVLWLAGIKVASIVARLALVGLLSPVRAVLTIVGRLFLFVARFNPWVLIATAVALAAKAIYDNWNGIVDYFKDKIDRVNAAFDEGWVQGIGTYLAEWNPVTLINDAMLGLAAYLLEEAQGWTKSIDEALTGFSLYDAGKNMIQTLWDGAKSLVGQMVADLKARIMGMLPDWLLTYIEGDGGSAAFAPAGVDTSGPMSSMAPGASYTQNSTFNITQRPGESTAELARRLDEYQRQGGPRAYAAQPLSDTPEDMQ